MAHYDPDSSCLRTSQQSLGVGPDWTSSSLALPDSGSMLSGRVYARRMSVPPMGASGGSALPTPQANLGRGTGTPSRQTAHLRQHVQGKRNLDDAVALLPTPAVNDMGRAYTPEEWDAWTERMRERHGNGNGHGKSLEIEAQRLLPTPTVGDAKSACNSTATRHRLPPTGVHAGDTLTDIVRKRSGATTPPPSTGGPPSSDGQLPLPPTSEDD